MKAFGLDDRINRKRNLCLAMVDRTQAGAILDKGAAGRAMRESFYRANPAFPSCYAASRQLNNEVIWWPMAAGFTSQ